MEKEEKGMIKFQEMTEAQILDRLLQAADEDLPTTTVSIKRLNIPIKLKAVNETTLDQLRKRCTIKDGKTETFDEEQYGYLVMVAGTVSPNWGDAKLLEKYKASGPEQVVRRILLPGEAIQVSDVILDLSGYGEDAVQEVKN